MGSDGAELDMVMDVTMDKLLQTTSIEVAFRAISFGSSLFIRSCHLILSPLRLSAFSSSLSTKLSARFRNHPTLIKMNRRITLFLTTLLIISGTVQAACSR